MASNSFGSLFRITTWGESHGPAIGVVIDGCPSGIALNEEDIQKELDKRAPGRIQHTSPRKEKDKVHILSGVFEGVTTAAPISLIIYNTDAKPCTYDPIKDILRPGHANFTYLSKYGVFDHRGGGRASARETACRVAAGAVAKKILSKEGIDIIAYLSQVGDILLDKAPQDRALLRKAVEESPIFCPHSDTTEAILALLAKQKEALDSIGGIISCNAFNLPLGLGDPVYEKIQANLAKGILSIPATKGIEFGEGFASAKMQGSCYNDLFTQDMQGNITLQSNHSGGLLGGITTGMPLSFQVAFKPTSSILQEQKSITKEGKKTKLTLPPGSRHDPCVAIRAVPVVEAMTALTLVDALLLRKIY